MQTSEKQEKKSLSGFLPETATVIPCEAEDQENYLLVLPTSSYIVF